jgi:hypothetical protein
MYSLICHTKHHTTKNYIRVQNACLQRAERWGALRNFLKVLIFPPNPSFENIQINAQFQKQH